MQFEDYKVGQILTVRPLDKRIDASTASDFKAKLLDGVQGNDCIILDLSEVDFLDSSALGAIVSSMKTLGSRGDFVICGAKEGVQSLFSLTRMNRVFQIFSSCEEALKTISARRGFVTGENNSSVIRLALTSDIHNVRLVGLAIKGIVLDTALAQSAAEVEVCVVEALTRVIEEAYGGTSGHELEMAVFLGEDHLTLQITDAGKSMDPKEAAWLNGPSEEDPSDKNMGLFIIKRVMDDVSYRTVDGKNILAVTKRLKRNSQSGLAKPLC